PDVVDSYHRTPLIWATLNDHSELAGLLIAHGCDLNWHDDKGNSALSVAAKNKNLPLVRKLLEHQSKVIDDDALALRYAFDSGRGAWRALLAAIDKNQLETARFRLERATDISTDQIGELLTHALEGEKRAIFHLLMHHGASPEGLERKLSTGMIMTSSPLTLA